MTDTGSAPAAPQRLVSLDVFRGVTIAAMLLVNKQGDSSAGYAALQHVPMGGHAWGPVYLLVRAPLQIFVLWWIWAMVLQVGGKERRMLAP